MWWSEQAVSALGSQRAEHPTDREEGPLQRLGVPVSPTGSGDLLALSKVLVSDASAWHRDHYFWAPAVGQSPTGPLCSVAWRGKGRAGAPGSSWPQLAPQAWLTETQEYAQHDVVLMLLGNKVSAAAPPPPPWLCRGWGAGGSGAGKPRVGSHQDPRARWTLPRSVQSRGRTGRSWPR